MTTKDNLKVPFYTHSIQNDLRKRGQPLYKGQNAGSRACPLFGGFTVYMHWIVVVYALKSL